MVRPLAGWGQPIDGLPPGTTWAKHSTPGEDTKAGGAGVMGRGRITRAKYRKALCSFQALQTDKLDDRRPAEMAARFGETPEPTVGLVGHSQVRQPAQENTLVKQGSALLPL